MSKCFTFQNVVPAGVQNRAGYVTTRSHGSKERPLSMISMNMTSHNHQRRWSVDFCKNGPSSVIIVKKNIKEPRPPQRSVSLLRLQTLSHSSFKRYSCPPGGISSTSSSCSSPPLVPTSVIIGHDPLGWKLQPKSCLSFSRERTKRLSLQVPLPVIVTPTTPNPEPSLKTKPALRPKPSRRHHSESSACLRLYGTALPVLSPEELSAVHLKTITLSDDSDNVFSDATAEQKTVPAPPRKTPPPVPVKTAMARQTAHLIASSRQGYRPLTAKSNKDKNNNTTIIKSKYSHQNEPSQPTCY